MHGLTLGDTDAPPLEIRAALGAAIDAHHARTVPRDATRFAIVWRDAAGALAAGVCASLAWRWMFVEALWVDRAWRGRGLGTDLLGRAEARARAGGCGHAWLDTFQAADFYLRLGYAEFGRLEDYPAGQTRHFLRKELR